MWLVAVDLTVAMAISLVACRTERGPAADTAEVVVGNRVYTVDLEACGQDDELVFLVGEGDGAVLQAAVEVRGEGEDVEAVIEAAGLSVLFEDGRAVGAFGREAAERAETPGEPAGEIDSVSVDGSRVRLAADAEVLDAENAGTGEDAGRVTIDANCPDPSEA
ncbi:MAG: hypothetical protein ACRD29_11800 [Acidimicrobiales bacterium]